MSSPVELNHSPDKVREAQTPKADSKTRGEGVQGLESRNAELKQQNNQEKEDRSLTLNEQLQKTGNAKLGVITRNFQQSIEITDGDKVVVKGRSKEEVAAVTNSQDKQTSQTGKEQEYQNRFGESADLPVGQAKQEGSAEATGKVIDYKVVKNSDRSFSLGMDYQENPHTGKPGDKLQDFMQAAAKRATDPEGWKNWA